MKPVNSISRFANNALTNDQLSIISGGQPPKVELHLKIDKSGPSATVIIKF